MLTEADLQRLLDFIGYGWLDAPLWFLGMEESLGKRIQNPNWTAESELKLRAAWPEVIDVRLAHELLNDPYWQWRDYTSVWKVMAQLTRGLLHSADDWADMEKVHAYVLENLGRSYGETLLSELLPLPSLKIGDWPYAQWYATREDYKHIAWPRRRDRWIELIGRHHPQIVICYGRGPGGSYWKLYQEIFPGVSWRTLNGDRVQAASRAGTRIYLMPFFGQGQYRKSDLEAVIADYFQL